MARTIGTKEPLKVAIADDSGLIYSDDYRLGWKKGFEAIGCEVKVFDINPLRRIGTGGFSPYRSRAMPGTAKALGEQIAKWKPDLVWCHHGRAASNPEFLSRLHRDGIQTAVYLCDEPYETGETARYSPRFKHVFTMDNCTVNVHRMSRADRANVYYLPPCADINHFEYNGYDDRDVPAFFLGNATLVPRPDWLKPVDRIVDGCDIRFFKTVGKRDPKWVNVKDHHKHYAGCTVGLNVHRDPTITTECYKKRVRGRPTQMEIPKGLTLCQGAPRKEGTGFWNDGNLPASHINPRFFEFAACGTLVVSDDHRSELARMFPMAPRASNPDQFLMLVRHYLNHPDEAEAIGRACSHIVSKRHSYPHRAAEALIRVGLRASGQVGPHSFLGEPRDWLTPQDLPQPTARSSSDPTGPSEPWSPAYGMSLTSMSGKPSDSDSLDVPLPWPS